MRVCVTWFDLFLVWWF